MIGKRVKVKPLTVGARVRVRIQRPDEYAQGAAKALDGALGMVEATRKDGEFRVLFNSPRPKWWTNQTPATAFWFPLTDLEVLDEAECAYQAMHDAAGSK